MLTRATALSLGTRRVVVRQKVHPIMLSGFLSIAGSWAPTEAGARGMYERAGFSREASTNSRGQRPRATETAAPTMCRIWCSMKEAPFRLTCSSSRQAVKACSAHRLFKHCARRQQEAIAAVHCVEHERAARHGIASP